ncbi:MAG: type II toxin-antitoxin system PemK/MazF family toxin [Candidatus Pacebacteria bacterium]|nr:type II toxin-antitoxin system PemK/MazF family toxin [Candidatus Paceibacterota bacterium]
MDDNFKNFLKDFVKWIKLKTRIHISDNSTLSFKQREIWWANVGLNVGSEQNGKNENFERPVLVLKKFGHHLFWAIPLTSKKKDSIYRYEINYKSHHKNILDEIVEESKTGFAILNQLKAMSSKRLIRKLGVLPKDDFNNLREELKNIL